MRDRSASGVNAKTTVAVRPCSAGGGATLEMPALAPPCGVPPLLAQRCGCLRLDPLAIIRLIRVNSRASRNAKERASLLPRFATAEKNGGRSANSLRHVFARGADVPPNGRLCAASCLVLRCFPSVFSAGGALSPGVSRRAADHHAQQRAIICKDPIVKQRPQPSPPRERSVYGHFKGVG